MKVKNVSKKIIGNSQFRLLPGDTMKVSGKEAWVRDYLAEKAIVEVKESAPDTQVNGAENSGKDQETPASADTARGRSGKKPADKT